MSDKDTILAILDRAGVVYKIETLRPEDGRGCFEIQIDVDDQPDQIGYSGFASCIYFKEDGSLLTIGAWE
jgi:hypothetical protein